MKYTPPSKVSLTDAESQQFVKVAPYMSLSNEPPDDWAPIAASVAELLASLLGRSAIPDIRLRLFDSPDLAETGARSNQQVFQDNGTTGDAIFRHPHFAPYLRHFIQGPDLPERVIHELCNILNEDSGTSGMLMDQCRKHARDSVRQFNLRKDYAATEFFRLGVEIGMHPDDARILRNAAKSTR